MCSLQNGSWAGGRWGVKVGFSRFIMGGGEGYGGQGRRSSSQREKMPSKA